MTKKQFIVLVAMSGMRSAAALLRGLDANSTGKDDEAAKAIEAALVALDAYMAQ